MEREVIMCEAGNEDAWICVCGNRPADDGFYSCDEKGVIVEPTCEAWTTGDYVCDRCGRIIDPNTLEVVGHRLQSA
jgi:hypothetical protein